MYYSSILKCDIANSTNGFTCTLFVSGCEHKCPGCFNPETHNPEYGKLFDEKAKEKIFNELSKPYCRGFSLLGGDPLSKFSDNRKTIISLCKEIKEKYPNKTIYLWTGYTIEEVESNDEMKDILKYIDIMIDGPFIESRKKLGLELRGSDNQRIINIKEYLSKKSV